MHAQDFLINNGSYGQTVETISESLPQLNIVSSLALVVETINSVNGGALVITSEQEKVLWVLDFIGEQQTDGF